MSDIQYTTEDLANFLSDPEGTIEAEKGPVADEAEVSTEEEETEALEGETEADETPEDSEDGPSDDDDADEDTDSQDEDDEDGELDLDQLIPLPGQDQKITLKELLDGNLRQADYTRKTQELSEERKAARAEIEAVRKERAQYAQLLPALEQQIRSAGEGVDWETLRNEDPARYLLAREEFQQKAAVFQAEKARLAQEYEKQANEAFVAEVSTQFEKLYEKRPEWRDEKVFAKARDELLKFGQSYGWSQEELTHATDHRYIVVLDELRALKKSLAKTSKQVETTAPTKKLAPVVSKNQSPRRKTELQRASERLQNPNKPGKVSDLAAYLSALDK